MRERGVFRPMFIPTYGKVLTPVSDKAKEIMLHIKRDALVEVHTPRNIEQHNLMWALAQVIAEAGLQREDGQEVTDKDEAMEQMLIAAGHFEYVVTEYAYEDGVFHVRNTRRRAKSIAFESVDQTHFARIFDRVVDVIVVDWMPGIKKREIVERLKELIDGDDYRRAIGKPAREPRPHAI